MNPARAHSSPPVHNPTTEPARPPAVRLCFPHTLTFSPAAWLRLQFLCHAGNTEVGAFGIGHPHNPLYILDLGLIRQRCSAVSVEFDDSAVADFFDDQIDSGRTPEQFARVWIHTHPGSSAEPSRTDEQTLDRVFGRCDWSVMFILARGGATTCRLRLTSPEQRPDGVRLAVERDLYVQVDWSGIGACTALGALEAWRSEHARIVSPVADGWAYPSGRRENTASAHRAAGDSAGGWDGEAFPDDGRDQEDLLDWFDGLDPDEQQAFLESTHAERRCCANSREEWFGPRGVDQEPVRAGHAEPAIDPAITHEQKEPRHAD